MPDLDHRLYLLAGPVLFAIGFYALMAQGHLLRRIMAINIMGNGVFLVFIALAAQTPGPFPDPVPHAMVLTGIVVAVCATGLSLALADAVQAATGRAELAEDDEEAPDTHALRSTGPGGVPGAAGPAQSTAPDIEQTGGNR
jgi:multicomponent Na+:H+ antiporter subunit C